MAVLTNTGHAGRRRHLAVSALTLTNVEVRGNTANVSTGNGGGIYASTAPSLTNVSVLNNSAQIGGGLFLLADGATRSSAASTRATTAGHRSWFGGVYAAWRAQRDGASVLATRPRATAAASARWATSR